MYGTFRQFCRLLCRHLQENPRKVLSFLLPALFLWVIVLAEALAFDRVTFVNLEVNALLKRHPQVRIIISGHHHLGKVQTVDGIHYLVNHSIITYPNRYTLYELTHKRLKYRAVPISDTEVIALARRKLLDKKNASISGTACCVRWIHLLAKPALLAWGQPGTGMRLPDTG